MVLYWDMKGDKEYRDSRPQVVAWLIDLVNDSFTQMRISRHFQSVNQSIKNTLHVSAMLKFYPKGNYFYDETRWKKIN